MGMPSYTAARVHDGRQWLPRGATIVTDDSGQIRSIEQQPRPDTHYLPGVLCPGFINAHCHLELSHLKGLAPQKTGIVDFLIFMSTRRQEFDALPKAAAIQAALKEMKRNGIVAVGDIANSTDTLPFRLQSGLLFHTFIEALGMVPAVAEKRFAYYRGLQEQFAAQAGPHRQSITPHAPYSVSQELFQLIDAFAPGSLLSIHSQEGACENELFQSGTGDMLRLFKALGLSETYPEIRHSNSLPAIAGWLDAGHPVLLVHNTFTCAADISFAKKRFKNLWFCLCPNANLYIEGRLPDMDLLLANDARICIGTDSLASNHELSVLAELQTLKSNFEKLSWETLLSWGTSHGAAALQMSDTLGTLSPGKTPGLLHLTGLEAGKVKVERIA